MRISAHLVIGVGLVAACGKSSPAIPDAPGSSVDATSIDGGAIDATPGMAITAPDQTWTWVPFENAFCADGSATGIGVNLSSASSRVLIYFEGGGACWDELTCYTLQTAANFSSGYGETNFTSESTDTSYLAAPGGFFDRTAAENPFKDYSYVYVPYCTGDLFAGNNVATYGAHTAHQVGYENIGAYLHRLVPTFPSAARVDLAGSSTGGFGAALNYSRVQAAFGQTRVDLIDDSGTFMPESIVAESGTPTIETTWRTAWNLAATLPAGCTSCTTALDAIYAFNATTFPSHSQALLSYTQDSVLPSLYGITTQQFTTGLGDEISTEFAPINANLKTFEFAGAGHVLFFSPTLTTGTTSLQQFLLKMTIDDAGWTSVTP